MYCLSVLHLDGELGFRFDLYVETAFLSIIIAENTGLAHLFPVLRTAPQGTVPHSRAVASP